MLLLMLTGSGYSQKNKKLTRENSTPYYPEAGGWAHQSAAEAGMDQEKLQGAIQYAIAHEAKNPRNLEVDHYQTFGKEPFGEGVGPFKDRGEQTGIIVRHGYLVAEWGEPSRTDMTHSVTKSFLSAVVGLAYDKGLIKSILDTVINYVPPVLAYQSMPEGNKADKLGQRMLLTPFETEHNRKITWNHLLRQTSDWEGTLWGKPEWADRPGDNPSEWRTRPRIEPGKVFEYNDVRVNVLSLAALSVWRRPLPQVLKEYIMDPIGATTTWRWYGYENSWVVLDGQAVQSVSGGGHWGGGMFINAYDMARFGYLTLRRGRWKDRQLLSDQWVTWSLTPTEAQPTYGFMNWFLNTDKKYLPDAPAKAFVHIGNGTNMIYVDPENDLVVVSRWIESGSMNEFIKLVLASLK